MAVNHGWLRNPYILGGGGRVNNPR